MKMKSNSCDIRSFSSVLIALSAAVSVNLSVSAPAFAVTYEVIHNFEGGGLGLKPYGNVVLLPDGTIYGYARNSTDLRTFVIWRIHAGKYEVVHSFNQDGNAPDSPLAGLISDEAGNIYGTTAYGGAADNGTAFVFKYGLGIRFLKLPLDAGRMHGGLTRDSEGNLYGGTDRWIYRIDPGFTSISPIKIYDAEGAEYGPPSAMDLSNGRLHGTSVYGGQYEKGTFFSVNLDGSDFQYGSNSHGYDLHSGLTSDRLGNYWGAARKDNTSNDGQGHIYKIDQAGRYKVVFRLDPKDGQDIYEKFTLGSDGKLYGVTPYGGPYGKFTGTVFQIDPSTEKRTIIHAFKSKAGREGGRFPMGSVTQGQDGALYGVAFGGGTFDLGVVYRITE